MSEPRYVELDLEIDHCEGCSTLTANPWGLCSRCTDEEANDHDFHRPLRVADPNGTAQ